MTEMDKVTRNQTKCRDGRSSPIAAIHRRTTLARRHTDESHKFNANLCA